MAVSTGTQPWEFTAQGDEYAADEPAYGALSDIDFKLRPYVRRIVFIAAAAGTGEIKDATSGETITGLITVGAAGAPVVIEVGTTVKGLVVTTLTGTGNKFLVYTGWPNGE